MCFSVFLTTPPGYDRIRKNLNVTGGRSVLKILLCDDDPFFMSIGSDMIGQIITEEKLNVEVVCMAKSDSEILSFLRNNGGRYLVFLDLDFGKGNLNGIDIAGVLRKTEPRVKIVFTTNHHEMALEVLKSGVEPFGFLEKSSDILTLRNGYKRYIRMALQVDQSECMAGDDELLSLSVIGGETVMLRRCAVIFLETEKNISHGITFHTVNGSHLTVIGTMDGEEERMGKDFIRVHRSYLVNRSHIIGIKDGYIKLSTQDEIPCSFRKMNEVKKCIGRK